MSRRRPASTTISVTRTSSGEGVGSPLGWLWTITRLAQLVRTASRKSSATRTTAVLRLPVYTVTTRIT